MAAGRNDLLSSVWTQQNPIMNVHVLILFCSIVGSSFTSAQVYSITFDGAPAQPRNTQFAIAQYTEAGMIFKPSGPIDSSPPYRLTRNGGGTSFYPENGTAYLQALLGDSLEFYALNGSAFSLVSVDLAEYSMFFTSPTVTFNGFKADGSTVSATFTLDGIIDGTGPRADFQTFSFESDFSSVVRVEVPTQGYSLDNLVISFNPVDGDGDGVPDDEDECPNTESGAVVDEHGCSIAQLVPCEGPTTGGRWKNHGQYVSIVAENIESFLTQGRITPSQAEAILEAAAQSDCGKK